MKNFSSATFPFWTFLNGETHNVYFPQKIEKPISMTRFQNIPKMFGDCPVLSSMVYYNFDNRLLNCML